MRTLVPLGLIAAALLAGCSADAPEAAQSLDGWEPSDPEITAVDCSELLEDWDGGADAPLRCWEFVETDGLTTRFDRVVADLEAGLGAAPAADSLCSQGVAPGRDMRCSAHWSFDDGHLMVVSGVTITGLEAAVKADVDISAATPIRHELTLWTLTDAQLKQSLEAERALAEIG
ncbi:hypothetical protein [uncultured Demequina sp.]|uniref:hypothetical protein n=1 Tax=uncultured Demequina sp. TaxID=693499 RepID=UPI0025D8A41A|nr:hypothetical protein [uncultured Demequina sp.]